MEAFYRLDGQQSGSPGGPASLTCHLWLEDARFRLAFIAVGAEQSGCAARREEWDYRGEWSLRGGELVFRTAECGSRDWPELEIASVEMAMMDQPFFKAHPAGGEFSARVLDAQPPGTDALPARLRLSVPREMRELGGFKYVEVELAKESRRG